MSKGVLLTSVVSFMLVTMSVESWPQRQLVWTSQAGRQVERRLVAIHVKDPLSLEYLVSEYDVWNVEKGRVVALVKDQEIEELREKGYAVEVIIRDVDALTKASKEISEAPALGFHTYDSLIADMRKLAESPVCDLYDIGDTWQERDIWALKISDDPNLDEPDEPPVLFECGIHAREWIAPEMCYALAEHLVDSYGWDSHVTNLVNNGEIWIIPVSNPDGRVYTETTDRLWRKNLRDNNADGQIGPEDGVDINRNFPVGFAGPGSSENPSSQVYRGPYALSEPESQALMTLALRERPVVALSYHSFGELVMFPWSYTTDPTPDDVTYAEMAKGMSELISQIHGEAYRTGQVSRVLYLAAGDAVDSFYGQVGALSFTIELRPPSESPIGFLLPEDQITPTIEENLPAALYLIEWSQREKRAGRLPLLFPGRTSLSQGEKAARINREPRRGRQTMVGLSSLGLVYVRRASAAPAGADGVVRGRVPRADALHSHAP